MRPRSRIGGPVAPFGVLAWSRGPVVLSGPRLATCFVPRVAQLNTTPHWTPIWQMPGGSTLSYEANASGGATNIYQLPFTHLTLNHLTFNV